MSATVAAYKRVNRLGYECRVTVPAKYNRPVFTGRLYLKYFIYQIFTLRLSALYILSPFLIPNAS
jgi:hypothetical protein